MTRPTLSGSAWKSTKGIGRDFLQEDAQTVGRWQTHKEAINKILTNDGVFLHFGWHTNGMGKKYGFALEEVLLVAHGSAHNDTICIAERRCQGGLFA